MAEPSVTAGTALATGLTVFGVSLGLNPAVLIAGAAGGLWAQSYHPPCSIWKRLAMVGLAAILAGYLAPLFAAFFGASDTVRGIVTLEALQLPLAVVVGLTSHRVLGPAIMRFAAKKADDYINKPEESTK